MPSDPLAVYVFIDSGYLRGSLQTIDVNWAEIDLRAVAKVAIQTVDTEPWKGRKMTLARVFVYDSLDMTHPDAARVEAWLEGNDRSLETHIRWGRMAGDPGKRGGRRQKAVDVQLAVDAVSWASRSVYDVALLVAGDADFVPVAEAVREQGPLMTLSAFRRSLAADLRNAVDRVGWLPDDPLAWDGWKLAPAT